MQQFIEKIGFLRSGRKLTCPFQVGIFHEKGRTKEIHDSIFFAKNYVFKMGITYLGSYLMGNSLRASGHRGFRFPPQQKAKTSLEIFNKEK